MAEELEDPLTKTATATAAHDGVGDVGARARGGGQLAGTKSGSAALYTLSEDELLLLAKSGPDLETVERLLRCEMRECVCQRERARVRESVRDNVNITSSSLACASQ